MKTIGGGRRSGRTTELIKMCHESELAGKPSYIVVHSSTEAHRVFLLAKEMGKCIPFPLTYEEFTNFHGWPVEWRFFIDNAEYLFSQLLHSPYEITAAFTIDEVLPHE